MIFLSEKSISSTKTQAQGEKRLWKHWTRSILAKFIRLIFAFYAKQQKEITEPS